MTSRERVKAAVAFQKPDIIPVDYWILPGAYLKYNKEVFSLLNQYPKDFTEAADENTFLPPSHRKGYYTDAFGCVWHQEIDGYIGIVSQPSLLDMAAFETYRFPEVSDGEITLGQIESLIEKHKSQGKYICADFIRTFERLHFMRGMENTMMDLAADREKLILLLDKIIEWNIAHLECVLDAVGDDVDGVWFSDDWGTQRSLLISPRMWREIFKPRYRRMFDFVKSRGKSVFFHSDGFIMDIIEDFIELEVDALNCQVALMGAKTLSERFGGRIAFHTDLDRQRILPLGSPGEVRRHIEDIASWLGRFDGGLILNAEFGPDMPMENIRCVFETFDQVRGR